MDAIINSTFFIPSEISSNIKYGYLYNWYAISESLFAPSGWHIATEAEWDSLITYYGGSSLAGGPLKETGTDYWDSPNTGATNESGLNIKGAGTRRGNGSFINFKQKAYYTLSEYLLINLNYDDTNINESGGIATSYARSVRLVADNPELWENGDTITDLDGNIYTVVIVNGEAWLKENWACSKLNDGTPIPNVTDNTEWSELTTGAYCNYDNDIENVFIEVPT